MATTKEYIIGTLLGLMGVAAGAMGGLQAGLYYEKPTVIHPKKVEGDAREFLVVETRGNGKIPFVCINPQEPFIRLEEAYAEQQRLQIRHVESETVKTIGNIYAEQQRLEKKLIKTAETQRNY